MLPLKSNEIKKREYFALLLNNNGLKGTAVEIGVDEADFSVNFLKQWEGKKYYGIDPYSREYEYGEFIGMDREYDFIVASKLYAQFPIAELLRETSEQAAGHIENDLDFVYIDGNHNYDEVKKDLYLWYPKIRSGGIFSGHDYNGDWIDHVRTAVIEFAYEHKVQIYFVLGDAASWYVRKP